MEKEILCPVSLSGELYKGTMNEGRQYETVLHGGVWE